MYELIIKFLKVHKVNAVVKFPNKNKKNVFSKDPYETDA